MNTAVQTCGVHWQPRAAALAPCKLLNSAAQAAQAAISRRAPAHTTTSAAEAGTTSVVGRLLERVPPGTNSVTTPVTRTVSPKVMVSSNVVPEGPKMTNPSEVASLASKSAHGVCTASLRRQHRTTYVGAAAGHCVWHVPVLWPHSISYTMVNSTCTLFGLKAQVARAVRAGSWRGARAIALACALFH